MGKHTKVEPLDAGQLDMLLEQYRLATPDTERHDTLAHGRHRKVGTTPTEDLEALLEETTTYFRAGCRAAAREEVRPVEPVRALS